MWHRAAARVMCFTDGVVTPLFTIDGLWMPEVKLLCRDLSCDQACRLSAMYIMGGASYQTYQSSCVALGFCSVQD